MQTWRRRAAGLVTALAIVALSRCSMFDAGEPLTDENVLQRVADAQRAAGTFGFAWTGPGPDGEGEVVITGELEYDDAGELTALAFTNRGTGQAYRLVDGKFYRKSEAGRFRRLGTDAKSSAIWSWDWAAAIETGPRVHVLREVGEQEVEGVSTTKYQLTFADHRETWFIDGDDQLIRTKSLNEEATLARYGEPVDITVPPR